MLLLSPRHSPNSVRLCTWLIENVLFGLQITKSIPKRL